MYIYVYIYICCKYAYMCITYGIMLFWLFDIVCICKYTWLSVSKRNVYVYMGPCIYIYTHYVSINTPLCSLYIVYIFGINVSRKGRHIMRCLFILSMINMYTTRLAKVSLVEPMYPFVLPTVAMKNTFFCLPFPFEQIKHRKMIRTKKQMRNLMLMMIIIVQHP